MTGLGASQRHREKVVKYDEFPPSVQKEDGAYDSNETPRVSFREVLSLQRGRRLQWTSGPHRRLHSEAHFLDFSSDYIGCKVLAHISLYARSAIVSGAGYW